MTKADIVEIISEKVGATKKEAQELTEVVFTILKQTLESGESIKISGFGRFEIKQKKDRTGRNPQTGKSMTIKARRILTFKSSALLRAAVNIDI